MHQYNGEKGNPAIVFIQVHRELLSSAIRQNTTTTTQFHRYYAAASVASQNIATDYRDPSSHKEVSCYTGLLYNLLEADTSENVREVPTL